MFGSVFMTDRTECEMNLKLNNDVRGSVNLLTHKKKAVSSVKEERQRTGRFIAILVGISLFLLAMYHAWVRKIPIVASLVVPALIMFVYVGWVLYTASRDKHKLLDLEAAMNAASMDTEDSQTLESTQHNIDISVISTIDTTKPNSPEETRKNWAEISSVLMKGEIKPINITDEKNSHIIKPVILVNDKPPEDLDEKWTQIVETVANSERFKGYQTRRKFKRKFCRSRRHAVFKRSYSIA